MLGEYFFHQKGFYSERTHYIVDFYLPKRRKLCLEIDGIHHETLPQLAYDSVRDRFLTEKRGFRVIRISNRQVENMSPSELLAIIKA